MSTKLSTKKSCLLDKKEIGGLVDMVDNRKSG